MKVYSEKDIKHSEILQLIILYYLYSLKESKDIYFQGGTAIRWCYNGTRFSEDLDFVTHLGRGEIESIVDKISEHVRRGAVAHFGQGEFEVKKRKTERDTSHVLFIQFSPLKERKKVSVKVEFEELKEGFYPETNRVILSMLPLVRNMINIGEFRIPNPNSIVIVESREEILSDKVRALLERRYLKGRDFYDIWFLTSTGVRCNPEVVKKKLLMYRAPFAYNRQVDFFLNLNRQGRREIVEAIRQDLSRFLPPQEMSLFESNDFKEMFDALKTVFEPLQGVELFSIE